jgi:hypothetical protein
LPVTRATECPNHYVVVTEPQQTNTPTDTSTTVIEATDMTSKRGGRRPRGSTVSAINAHNTLVEEALGECTIDIDSIKYTAAEKSYRPGNGNKWSVPRGAYEKAALKVCKKCNLERSEMSMDTTLRRTKVGRKLKVNHRCT